MLLIAVHLRDMNAIYQINPCIRDATDGRPLIDFVRCTKLFTKIEEIDHFVSPDLSSSRSSGPMAYLESQLRGVPMHSRTDEMLESRSVDLAAKEQRDRQLRLPQLKSVGFRT
jgi:son of sevenless-like protein